jgi:hypothetical protein
MRTRFVPLLAFLLTGFAYVHPATAQDETDEDKPAEEGAAEEEGAAKEESTEAVSEDKLGADSDAAADSAKSPVEEKGVTYRFVGLRYRGLVVPQFMESAFGADGGSTVYAHNFGPEFIVRKDNFEYAFSLTYTDYSFDPTPFKAKSDGEDAWELVESHIKVLYLGADFLWSHPFNPKFALSYGLGAGLGIVWGDLNRVQAYKDASGDYQPCIGPGNPASAGFYCGADNDHYGDYTEPSWADGGSKPIVFPWLAGQVGLRFKPHRNFQAHLDAGIAVGHVFFGLGADYGL